MAKSLGIAGRLVADSSAPIKKVMPVSVNKSDTSANTRKVIMNAQDSGEFVDQNDAAELERSRISKQRISQQELMRMVAAAQAQQASRGNK
jgi:hypothetical protein